MLAARSAWNLASSRSSTSSACLAVSLAEACSDAVECGARDTRYSSHSQYTKQPTHCSFSDRRVSKSPPVSAEDRDSSASSSESEEEELLLLPVLLLLLVELLLPAVPDTLLLLLLSSSLMCVECSTVPTVKAMSDSR